MYIRYQKQYMVLTLRISAFVSIAQFYFSLRSHFNMIIHVGTYIHSNHVQAQYIYPRSTDFHCTCFYVLMLLYNISHSYSNHQALCVKMVETQYKCCCCHNLGTCMDHMELAMASLNRFLF